MPKYPRYNQNRSIKIRNATTRHPEHHALGYKVTDCQLCYPNETEEQRAEWREAVMNELRSKYENPEAIRKEIAEAIEDESSS